MAKQLPELTMGAIADIYKDKTIPPPVLQLLAVRKSSDRQHYRLRVSDGAVVNSFTMLAPQLNPMVERGELSKFSVFTLTKSNIGSVVKGNKLRRILVLLDLKVKVPGEDVGMRIGKPITMENSKIVANSENNSTNGDDEEPPAKKPRPAPATCTTSRLNDHPNSGTQFSTIPIDALNFSRVRWVMKVRVRSKTAIRPFSNARSQRKLFSVDLVDKTGEIRCLGFDGACDKYYGMLEIGKCYYISGCQIQLANKNFNDLNNQYELFFVDTSKIALCEDDEDMKNVSLVKYNFMPIANIAKMKTNDYVDVLAVAKHVNEVQKITARMTGKEVRKRDVELVDMSGVAITLTLWEIQAENFDGSSNSVIAIKGARIGELRGQKVLSALTSTVMHVDPELPDARRLRRWWNTSGKDEKTSLRRPP